MAPARPGSSMITRKQWLARMRSSSRHRPDDRVDCDRHQTGLTNFGIAMSDQFPIIAHNRIPRALLNGSREYDSHVSGA